MISDKDDSIENNPSASTIVGISQFVIILNTVRLFVLKQNLNTNLSTFGLFPEHLDPNRDQQLEREVEIAIPIYLMKAAIDIIVLII